MMIFKVLTIGKVVGHCFIIVTVELLNTVYPFDKILKSWTIGNSYYCISMLKYTGIKRTISTAYLFYMRPLSAVSYYDVNEYRHISISEG